ncbi:MAG: THUMP domain-containing protein [Spirochaetales bacterium]
MSSLTYRLTTNPGLEDIVEMELRERLATVAPEAVITVKPQNLAGVLQLDPGHCDRSALEAEMWKLRSIFHVIRHLRSITLSAPENLDELIDGVSKTEFPNVSKADTFRVTSRRIGEHPFGSMDIERAAGAVVNRSTGMRVDLENFTVHVRVDLTDKVGTIGVQLTRFGLDRRHRWVFRPRVALRTTVAYGMLRLARLSQPPKAIIDPFCGSATVLLEAAALWPHARGVGVDKFSTCVDGANANVKAAGLSERIEIVQADARDLAELYEAGAFDAVICNPPFGVRLGQKTDFEHLYRRFLYGVEHILAPGGRVVFLGGKRRHHVAHIVSRIPTLRIVHVRVIETSGVYPAVYVLERMP